MKTTQRREKSGVRRSFDKMMSSFSTCPCTSPMTATGPCIREAKLGIDRLRYWLSTLVSRLWISDPTELVSVARELLHYGVR